MRGLISFFDKDKKKCFITGEDENQYELAGELLESLLDFLQVGVKVDFAHFGFKVTSLDVDNNQSKEIDKEDLPLSDPSEFSIYTDETVPEGQILVVKADTPLECEARSVNVARWRLMNQTKKFGGNILVNYQETSFIKNSIAFSYEMKTVRATPAVAGVISPKGIYSFAEMKNRLRTDLIAREAKIKGSVEKGKNILRWVMAVLFIIFLTGFILSLI
ncbi:MAG: hypothetical protein J6M93_04465 [Succinivibrio sp.]|nr:hypothetical protein [Succinivibrio sp.]